MKTEYNINKQSHYITYYKKNDSEKIAKSIELIESDKNILLIYDEKISTKIIKNISEELNLFGCNLIKLKCKGNKINKNEKLLFKILDLLISRKFTKRW